MRYRTFLLAGITALVTFVSLQLTLGRQYWGGNGWGWRHHWYRHYEGRPDDYDGWYREYEPWQRYQRYPPREKAPQRKTDSAGY